MQENLNQLKPKIEQRSCHVCGNKEFEWGFLKDTYYQQRWRGGKVFVLASRKCQRCGNIQVFTDQTKTKSVQIMDWISSAILFGFFALMMFLSFSHLF